MARYWVYLNDGVQGPFELDQLIRLRGFSRQTRVSIEGPNGQPGDWMSPADIPSLAPIFKAAEQMNEPDPVSSAPKPAPRMAPRPAARPAVRPRIAKDRSGQWIKSLAIIGVIGAVIVGAVFVILRQEGMRKEEREMACQLVLKAALPDRLYSTLGQYLTDKKINPRWEVEKKTDGLYHVTLSWFGEGSRQSTVIAFESNTAVRSVRGLNTAASKLLTEGILRPASPVEPTAVPAKKKSPSPATTFDPAVHARAKAVEEGEYETVWNTFSRRKRSDMIQAGMSREGFLRLQGLTHKLESGLRQEVLKSHSDSDTQRLVLIRETRKPHGELFLKQRWIYEDGDWKLDEEEKRAPEAPPSASAAEEAPTPPTKVTIPLNSLPGISN